MKKRIIVSSSIIFLVVSLIGLLFGVVFSVRKMNVSVVNGAISVSNRDIVASSGIKHGTPIFFLDKNKAIDKIEKSYPYVKVVQIRTTNPITLEFVLTERKPLYYTQIDGKYFVLDEDLKILSVEETLPALIKIDAENLKINSNNKKCDFVGTGQQKIAYKAFYIGMYSTGFKDGKDIKYFERIDMIDKVAEIKIQKGYSPTAELTRLIVVTKEGIEFDIIEPNINIDYKMNICWATVEKFKEDSKDTSKGTIKIYYNLKGKLVTAYYLPESETPAEGETLVESL